MKCLFGIYKMDAGEVYLDGQKIVVNNPDEAMKYGIAMVHQEVYTGSGKNSSGKSLPWTFSYKEIRSFTGN